MPEPLPTRRKIFDLEGEAQRNPDGRSRQEELFLCTPGEPVSLRLERNPGTEIDRVDVVSCRGVPIGRLTSQYAGLLAPLLRPGRAHRAKLHCLRGGIPGYPRYGARISIAWDGRPEHPHLALDPAQIRYRHRRFAALASWRRRAARRIKAIADRAADLIDA
jgi:hypothetical protein